MPPVPKRSFLKDKFGVSDPTQAAGKEKEGESSGGQFLKGVGGTNGVSLT